VHEIKHDGYRLIVRREGDAIRLFTRRGHDWTERYPAIAAAAAKLRARSFTLTVKQWSAGPKASRCSTRSAAATAPTFDRCRSLSGK